MRSAVLMVAVVAVGVLTACAAGGGEPAPAAPASPADSEPPPATGTEGSITGTLGGDAQLEGGCSWIDDGTTRWQVQYPHGYAVTFDPLTLRGPDGVVAEEGDTVTVAGAEQTDVMTICQVGPVWAATSVTLEPPSPGGSPPSS